MRRIIRGIVFSLVAATAGGQQTASPAAMTANESWLGLMDAARYAEAWSTAAPVMQSAMTEAEFAKVMTAAREPFGKLETRVLQQAQATEHLPGAPDGHYVVAQYSSRFAKKAEGVETVVASQAQDGSWHVSGYFIK